MTWNCFFFFEIYIRNTVFKIKFRQIKEHTKKLLFVHQQLPNGTFCLYSSLPQIYCTVKNPPDGIVICPGFLFRLCPGCPGFDTGFILKINQNVHLFIFSTISELFNVYWYHHKVLGAARWEDKAIIKLSEFIWNIPRLFRHYHGMPWL